MTSYINNGEQWKRGINIYYTMDSVTYRLMVEENQWDPNLVTINWVHYLPSETNMELNQYMVLPNKYAEFIWCLNNICPDTAQQINNTIHGYSRIWRHELGHIFGLRHSSISPHYSINECEYSIMHQGSQTACWLPPSEIGQMFRFLHTSNTRRYILANTYFPSLSYNIADTVTWNYNIRAYSDIIIEEGGMLEITCEVHLPEEASIIVKRGGQFILNGGLLRSYDTVLWQGIQVWGNQNLSQSTPGAQGKITITNGGTIENAVNAVILGRFDGEEYVQGYEGGIIQTNDAHFINNRNGVVFYPYRNMVSGQEMDNLSYLQITEFLTDAELSDASFPENFIYLEGVKGIGVQGCSFTNSRSQEETQIRERGIGIYSEDANFTVTDFCVDGYPCEDPVPTVFQELNYGIKAYKLESTKTFEVNNSNFFNNLTGIYVKGVDFPTIIFNSLQLKNVSLFHQQSNDIFGGIYLDNSTGYTIEENLFYNDNPYDPQGEIRSIGITVDSSGNDFNMIYRNTFDRLHVGILAQNNNRGIDDYTGLKLKCNVFTNNEGDIAVTADGTSLNQGISHYQGAYIPGDETAPAGNLFSHKTNNDPYSDFNNTIATSWIIYFHHTGTPSDPWIPVYYQNITPFGYVNYLTHDDVCPSNFILGGGQQKSAPIVMGEEELKTRMNTMENMKDSASNVLSLWIDAGNTPQLDYDVETSTPPQSLDIYDELIADSPYLSDTVLSTSIEKDDVLVNAMIRDIMVANPHGAKKDEMIQALEQRVPPVPEYMMAEIIAGIDSLSLKEHREGEIAWYKQERDWAFNKLINLYLNDTSIMFAEDSIASLIADHGALRYHYYLANRYLEKDDTLNAFAVLENIPNQFVLNPEQQIEHQDYLTIFTMIKSMQEQGNPLDSLDASARQLLYQIADNNSQSAAIAQNILQHIDTINFPEEYVLPVSGPVLRKYNAENPHLTEASDQATVFRVYPNPCRDYFLIEYKFESIKQDVIYSITDPQGREIDQGTLDGLQNQIIKRTSSYGAGIHTIRLLINGKEENILKLNVIR